MFTVKKYFWLGVLICVVVGGYLRGVNIENNPPHLGNDEISIAFDSYSVRTIGKDEHGNWWPLSFQSHQTYKAPLYAYLNMPFNLIWGNTEAGVRYLSVLSGTLAIVMLALIGSVIAGEPLGLLTGLILALNPKGISVSRIAFESNLASTMMLVAVYFMIRFRKNINDRWLYWAGLFFGLSIWGYHTQWGLAPMLAVIFPWLARKEIPLKRWWKMWLVIIMVALPIFINFISVAILDPNNRANSQLWVKDAGIENLWKDKKISLVKKVMVTAEVPFSNYVAHFGLADNFTSGLLFSERSPMDSGWHLLATLPLIILGLFAVKKYLGKWSNWFWWWWLLCPVVPALTLGGVASVRNLSFIYPTILLAAIGWLMIYSRKKWCGIVYLGLILANFYFFSRAYYIHFRLFAGDNFQYGYKQAWEFMKPNISDYDHVVVEPKFGHFGQFVGVPHLYFGYFGAFTAVEMQTRVDYYGTKIGKFEFRDVDWNAEELRPKSIYVVSVINPMAGKAYGKLSLIGEIKKPDNEEQFLIYSTN